jgi:hypothetical protein
MTNYETEAVTARIGKTRFRKSHHNHHNLRNAAATEILDYAAFGIAAIMMLFAYAVGFGVY